MSAALIVHEAGPGVTVQDLGRPGVLSQGVSQGGAADRLALWEGAALLSQDPGSAALEFAASGGVFEATIPTTIALTGAPLRATLDGAPLAWNATHHLPAGARLAIRPGSAGVYGYLHLSGGLLTIPVLGSRSTHLSAGIGAALVPGDHLPLTSDATLALSNLQLPMTPRFEGGKIRLVAGPQTPLFPRDTQHRFASTSFRRDARGNRMGVGLDMDGPGFSTRDGLGIVSEITRPGDVQMTGAGKPYVLLCDCQTTGGYPRIGSVLPMDLPRVVQARAGDPIRFEFVDLQTASLLEQGEHMRRQSLGQTITPLIRDPRQMGDLLSYQLVGGITAGDDLERDET